VTTGNNGQAARGRKRRTARGHTLANPQHQWARRQRISRGGRQVRRAHKATSAHHGAYVATLRCSTTAENKRADAPAPDAAGPPAPAAEKSSRTTEEARWRRHRAPAGRAGAGARTRLSTDPRGGGNSGENAPAAAGSRICTVISSPIEPPRATESDFPRAARSPDPSGLPRCIQIGVSRQSHQWRQANALCGSPGPAHQRALERHR